MAIEAGSRICIVGAGPAGLATAHRLRHEGYTHVTVLEKLPEVGGLCLTYEYEGRAFDLGANYVTSAYTRIRAMAAEVGASMYIEAEASFFDTTTHRYQSIRQTAQGSTSFFRFGLDCLRYLRKRRALDRHLPASGYGEIDSQPDLLCSFGEWLDAEGLAELRTLFEIPITLMGYGDLDEIPAPYALTYMSVRTVIDLIIYGSLPFHRWPRRFDNGFQRFWERVAEPLDVRTDVQISGIVRSPDGVTVTAEFPQRVGDHIERRVEVHEFDWLVLACPLQHEVLTRILDETSEEAELFDRITINPFCVTTFDLEASPGDGLHTRLVNVLPIPERATAQPTILTQQFSDDPLVTFYTPVSAPDDSIRDDVLKGVRGFAHELGIVLGDEPITWDNFPYFPQVTVEDFRSGWYRRVEALQGQNRTFYNGGILAFELIEPIVEYSDALVARFFTGTGR